MMKANYSMMTEGEEYVGTTLTWSSMGPPADGDSGVNIMAPGGAITCVPNWMLQKSQLMNGTSMSSPHAAGCVALLLSACKAKGIPIFPSRIYRAIENTAKQMNGLSTLQQGWGMIQFQFEKAWEYLLARNECDAEET
jgi:tripeptidyl-peptidase-2